MDEPMWLNWVIPLFNILLPLILLLVAWIVGQHLEKQHYASILQREAQLRHIMVVASRFPPKEFAEQQLVRGSVVVSSDYFRRLLAAFRQIFGGNVRSYETLLDRARREAILRMKEEAAAQGAEIIFNMKLETSSLSTTDRNNGGVLGTVEVLAYGTAGKLKR